MPITRKQWEADARGRDVRRLGEPSGAEAAQQRCLQRARQRGGSGEVPEVIRYWSLSLLGMLVSLASLLVMTWALYHLVRTGTCASGGPYVSARPCP